LLGWNYEIGLAFIVTLVTLYVLAGASYADIYTDAVQAILMAILGIVVFGSVARGEADRASDIDLLVIVGEDKTAARRSVQSIVSDLEDRRFEGNRYTFQPLVESTDSVRRIGDQLRPQFEDGVTLVGSDQLSELRTEVYTDE